mgnify:CR=1 FL=1
MNKQKEKEFLIENYPRTINDFMERELFLYDNTKKSRERTIRDVKLEFIENILGAMYQSKNKEINYIVTKKSPYSRRNETNSYMKCFFSFIDYCLVIKEKYKDDFEKILVELEEMYDKLFQDYEIKNENKANIEDVLKFLFIEENKENNYNLTQIFEILLKFGIDIMLNKNQIMINFQKSFERRAKEIWFDGENRNMKILIDEIKSFLNNNNICFFEINEQNFIIVYKNKVIEIFIGKEQLTEEIVSNAEKLVKNGGTFILINNFCNFNEFENIMKDIGMNRKIISCGLKMEELLILKSEVKNGK